jgi:hypothetical protein
MEVSLSNLHGPEDGVEEIRIQRVTDSTSHAEESQEEPFGPRGGTLNMVCNCLNCGRIEVARLKHSCHPQRDSPEGFVRHLPQLLPVQAPGQKTDEGTEDVVSQRVAIRHIPV